MGGQNFIAFDIIIGLLGVNATIQFYDQTRLVAIEVHNKASNYLLTAKVETIELVRPKRSPEYFFGIRRVVPQLFGPLPFNRGHRLTHNEVFGHGTSPLTPLRVGEGNNSPLPLRGSGTEIILTLTAILVWQQAPLPRWGRGRGLGPLPQPLAVIHAPFAYNCLTVISLVLRGLSMTEEMTKAQLLDLLRTARAEWDALLAQIPPDQMSQPGVAGPWSVKDNIAHMTHFERWHADRIDEALHGVRYTTTPFDRLSVEEQNTVIYDQHRDQPLADVLAESRAAYEKLMQAVAAQSEAFLISQPHPFEGLPGPSLVWQMLEGDVYGHYPDHMIGIKQWWAAESK